MNRDKLTALMTGLLVGLVFVSAHIMADNITPSGETDTGVARLATSADTVVVPGDLSVTGTLNLPSDLTDMFRSSDGMAYDKPDLTIVDATGLQLDVEKVGGGDMDFRIGGVVSTLDCTTGAGAGGKARVALTAGSDANTPATNYIYVTDSGGTASLNASTALPTGSFAWVAKICVPDATTWGTTGAYAFQRYTESFLNDSRGLFSHEREKLRALGAVYIGGLTHTTNITTNVGVPDTVHLEVATGQVYQLHRQTFPTTNTGPYYYGNGTTPFASITDLAGALTTSDGTAITTNRRFNLVIWGAVNITSGECKLFVNLPTDTYGSDSEATADAGNTADYGVPDDMRSVAFMIARVALKYTTLSGGTWTELGTYSLLGTPPGVTAGGAGAVEATEFGDSTFRIYDGTDPTKQIAFEASSISTGTVRTITMPDQDVTLGSGGVTPPGSSTDNAIVRWDGVGADTIQNSGVTIDDSGNVVGVGLDTGDTNDSVRFGESTGAGNESTTIGSFAGAAMSGIGSNSVTAIGREALYSVNGGDRDTAVGDRALVFTLGSENTAVGWSSGDTITTGDYNSVFGAAADVLGIDAQYQTVIGAYATATADNQVMLGTATEEVVMPGDAQVDGTLNADGNLTVGASFSVDATFGRTTAVGMEVSDPVYGLTCPNGSTISITPDNDAPSGENGSVAIKAGTVSGSVTINGLTYPAADGSDGWVMTTDGAGNIAFEAAGGGGISNVVEDTTPQLGGDLDWNSMAVYDDMEINVDEAGATNPLIWVEDDAYGTTVTDTRGVGSIDLQADRNGVGDTSRGPYSVLIGGDGNSIGTAGDYTAIVGAISSSASGDYSFIGGGGYHIGTNTYSGILGGYQSYASGQKSASVGGHYCRPTDYGQVSMGVWPTSSGGSSSSFSASNMALQIGDGTGNSSLSDCFTVDFGGNTWMQGDLDADGDGDIGGQLSVASTITVDSNGYLKLKSSTDAAAPSSSLYFSTTGDGITWKDENGYVHVLATTTPP